MKEMMIKLPVIDIAASDQTTLAKHAIKANTVANRCKHFETWY